MAGTTPPFFSKSIAADGEAAFSACIAIWMPPNSDHARNIKISPAIENCACKPRSIGQTPARFNARRASRLVSVRKTVFN
jgi:hypothetical protein